MRAIIFALVTTLAACGGKSTASTTKTPPPPSGACTPEECAAAAEPPIAPSACGDGHESDIATVCERVESGTCQKVLHCKNADAATPEAGSATP